MTPQQLCDYDLWANEQWIDPADKIGRLDILEHVARASEIWLSRCQHVAEPDRQALPLLDRFRFASEEWQEYLMGIDFNSTVHFHDRAGNPRVSPLDGIFHHVINHGTYHRGQLRQLAESAGVEFPETDLIGYVYHLQTVS